MESLPDCLNVTSTRGSVRTRRPLRKSRGKGLRTKTGCITCRKRHKKCNEAQPICGNCASASRICSWPDSAQPLERNSDISLQRAESETWIPRDRRVDVARTLNDNEGLQCVDDDEPVLATYQIDSPQPSHVSPSNTLNSELLTADLASIRWLDLLAEDALQANRGFTRPSSPVPEAANGDLENNHLQPSTGAQNLACGNNREPWQLDKDIVLKNEEFSIFRNFVEHSALWLDLFDPQKHFSIYSTRLALRNTGLLKAIMALSAQHLLRQDQSEVHKFASDQNLAIQYYYETLHYVQTALQYNSYAHSEELLATTLIISTYEMLNESQLEWQRHLKGVFWIQRSQNVDGASGGIRQAVWWAWLRQDVWAAFREKRKCFSFWKPTIDHVDLNPTELIDRSVYLFSQAVNYCADITDLSRPDSIRERLETADVLLGKLDHWKSCLGEAAKSLPISPSDTTFQRIWIHPPHLGVALQVFYFARILITLHRPAMSGLNSYMKMQKSLSEAVSNIAGIAMELKEEGCQIVSAQCLFGAGLCVQKPSQRLEIISLIAACEARTGWPMSTLREDLHQEWKKLDSDDTDTDAAVLRFA